MEILINGKDVFSCSIKTIHEAWFIMKEANRSAQRRKALKFYSGQKVSFFSKRKQIKVIGTIKRINKTSITVVPDNTPRTTWKVPPSLLTSVEESKDGKMIRRK